MSAVLLLGPVSVTLAPAFKDGPRLGTVLVRGATALMVWTKHVPGGLSGGTAAGVWPRPKSPLASTAEKMPPAWSVVTAMDDPATVAWTVPRERENWPNVILPPDASRCKAAELRFTG